MKTPSALSWSARALLVLLALAMAVPLADATFVQSGNIRINEAVGALGGQYTYVSVGSNCQELEEPHATRSNNRFTGLYFILTRDDGMPGNCGFGSSWSLDTPGVGPRMWCKSPGQSGQQCSAGTVQRTASTDLCGKDENPNSFVACWAVGCIQNQGLNVCFRYEAPANGNADLVQATVTVTNTNTVVVPDARFRYSMPLTPEPSTEPYVYSPAVAENKRPFPASYLTVALNGPSPPALACSSNTFDSNVPYVRAKPGCVTTSSLDPAGTWRAQCVGASCGAADVWGCTSPNPGPLFVLGPGSESGGAPFDSVGPCVQGATVQLNLGDILPGKTRTFWMWFGGALDKATMKADLASVGSQWYALATHIDGTGANSQTGTPVTFGWGIKIESPKVTPSFTSALPPWPLKQPLAAGQVCADLATRLDATVVSNLPTTDTWDFGDGTQESYTPGTPVYHAFAPGKYQVTATSIDSQWAVDHVTMTLTAIRCDAAPVPAFTVSGGGRDCVDNLVHFDGAASADPDGGGLASYTWDFGDGTTGSGVQVPHQFKVEGDMQVQLTVRDEEGDLATVTQAFLSDGDPNCRPHLEPVPDMQIVEGDTLEFPVAASDGDGPWLDVRVQAMDKPLAIEGPTGVTAFQGRLVFRTQAIPPATYHFRLRAVDGIDWDERIFNVTVRAPPDTFDLDRDGVQDSADNCPAVPNVDQADADGDSVGDACDGGGLLGLLGPGPSRRAGSANDRDRDGTADTADNCPDTPNPSQGDLDRDGLGDACDTDQDGDGVAEATAGFGDNCPLVPNPDQGDANLDGRGDACARGPRAETAVHPVAGLASRTVSPSASPWQGALVVLLVAGAVAAVLLRRYRAEFVLVFSRLSRVALLEHPLRQAVVDALEQRPGLHTGALAEQLGVGRTTLRHHLDSLAAAGLIHARKVGNLQAWFATPVDAGKAARAVVLRAPLAHQLAELARAEPGTTIAEAARRLHSDYRATLYQVRRLQQAGILAPDASQGLNPLRPI